MKVPKPTLPPQAFENDFLPNWEVTRSHYDQKYLKRREAMIAARKKVVAAAQAKMAG